MVNPIFTHFQSKTQYLKEASNIQNIYFGFNSFRNHQIQCINSLWESNTCVILSPTGSGKSLCYTIPALMSKNLTLVITPLISLMEDQVKKLKQKSIRAERLHSGLDPIYKRTVLSKLKNNQVKLLFISAERFSLTRFRNFIKQYNKVDIIAIDEAHCISEWKFFRPCYAKLKNYISDFSNPSTIFLTATATKSSLEAISDISNFNRSSLIVSHYSRDNLNIKTYFCSSYEEKISSMIECLKQQSGSGIIYTITQDEVEHIHKLLSSLSIPCFKYHAGLSPLDKQNSFKHFINDSSSIIVATKAFGMGIDKPDIRFVIHSSCPSSMEDYFQEIGRAGRDGLKSNTIMYYTQSDISTHKFMFDISLPEPRYINKIYQLSVLLLQNHPLSKKDLISRIQTKLQARTPIGISNTIDILLRFHLIQNISTQTFFSKALLKIPQSFELTPKSVGKIILEEKQERLKKLNLFIKYLNTTNHSLKEKIYYSYFTTNNN